MPATFTVLGQVWEFIPDGTVPDPYLGTLSAVTGRFVANVSPQTALPVSDGEAGGVMYLDPVDFSVLSDGQISADGENPGVPLLCDDVEFGLGRPLRWSLIVDAFDLDGVVIEPPVVWVDAPQTPRVWSGLPTEEVSLSLWAADVDVWPIAVARGPRGLRGYPGVGATKGLIVAAGDPEGSVMANKGTLYSRTDGNETTPTLYVKESGVGYTGWVAVVTVTSES